MSLLDYGQLNSPEVIFGLSSVTTLMVVLIIGFFYKRYKSKQ